MLWLVHQEVELPMVIPLSVSVRNDDSGIALTITKIEKNIMLSTSKEVHFSKMTSNCEVSIWF